jgi:hypothetical protein
MEQIDTHPRDPSPSHPQMGGLSTARGVQAVGGEQSSTGPRARVDRATENWFHAVRSRRSRQGASRISQRPPGNPKRALTRHLTTSSEENESRSRVGRDRILAEVRTHRTGPRTFSTPRLQSGITMSINETDGGSETHVVDHEAAIYRNSEKGDEAEPSPGYCGARVAAADHVLRVGPAPSRRPGDRTHHPPPHGPRHPGVRTTRRGAMPAGDSREAARANHAHRRVRARSARRPDRGGRLDHHRRARHHPGRPPRSHPARPAPPRHAATGRAMGPTTAPTPDHSARPDAPPRPEHRTRPSTRHTIGHRGAPMDRPGVGPRGGHTAGRTDIHPAERTARRTDRHTAWCTAGRTDVHPAGRTARRMDGRTAGRMDGRMDGAGAEHRAQPAVLRVPRSTDEHDTRRCTRIPQIGPSGPQGRTGERSRRPARRGPTPWTQSGSRS